jgi:hypothetical protein
MTQGAIPPPIAQAKLVAERDSIIDALTQTRGNRVHTAGVLGVSKQHVHKLLHRYPDVAERFPVATGRPAAPPPGAGRPKPRPKLRVRVPLGTRFETFHAAHPAVYRELVRLARREVKRGRRPGIGMIWEVMRWRVAGPRRLRLNNDWRSRYARLIQASEPDLAGVFRTRKLRA